MNGMEKKTKQKNMYRELIRSTYKYEWEMCGITKLYVLDDTYEHASCYVGFFWMLYVNNPPTSNW